MPDRSEGWERGGTYLSVPGDQPSATKELQAGPARGRSPPPLVSCSSSEVYGRRNDSKKTGGRFPTGCWAGPPVVGRDTLERMSWW